MVHLLGGENMYEEIANVWHGFNVNWKLSNFTLKSIFQFYLQSLWKHRRKMVVNSVIATFYWQLVQFISEGLLKKKKKQEKQFMVPQMARDDFGHTWFGDWCRWGGGLLVCLMKINTCDVIICHCLAQLCSLRTDLSVVNRPAPWWAREERAAPDSTRVWTLGCALPMVFMNKHQHGNDQRRDFFFFWLDAFFKSLFLQWAVRSSPSRAPPPSILPARRSEEPPDGVGPAGWTLNQDQDQHQDREPLWVRYWLWSRLH